MEEEIRTVLVQLDEFIEDIMKDITLEATANFIQDTPVDTGWARANWVPNIGAEGEGTAGTREQAEAGNVMTADQQQGIAAVATQYTIISGPIYITNNVPYINRLNEGSSNQAPAGFVQAGINRAIATNANRRNV